MGTSDRVVVLADPFDGFQQLGEVSPIARGVRDFDEMDPSIGIDGKGRWLGKGAIGFLHAAGIRDIEAKLLHLLDGQIIGHRKSKSQVFHHLPCLLERVSRHGNQLGPGGVESFAKFLQAIEILATNWAV